MKKSSTYHRGYASGFYIVAASFRQNSRLMDRVPVQELAERTKIILSYALCGFANIGSIGVLVGGMGALMPSRRGDIARLGLLALVGGTCSTFMTAIIAGDPVSTERRFFLKFFQRVLSLALSKALMMASFASREGQ